MTTSSTSRRQFLKMASSLGALGVGAPLGLNLAAIKAAAAQSAPTDYKALVCIFLYGGNDSNNTIVPYDAATHARYKSTRGAVGIDRHELSNTVIDVSGGWGEGRRFALNPAMGALKGVFDQGRLGTVMSVGTLKKPITIEQYRNNIDLPPKLMSHNDQFSLWQSSLAEGATSGWGGRMGDLFEASNGDSGLITNITVGPSATFSTGQHVQEFSMGAAGPVQVDSGYIGNAAAAVQAAIKQNLESSSSHLLKAELTKRHSLTVEGYNLLQQGLANSPSFPMPETDLGKQMNMVARIIAANQVFGLERQVFFVGMGGFDNHNSLIDNHPLLLGELSDAMASFQSAIDGIGLSEKVTTFTASDFGRSLTSNGNGSDHGWGAHHLVMGGAVNAKSWVGKLPTLELNAEDDIGQGRLLPSVSVDQYAATLALWMGVSMSELPNVLPGIGEFDQIDLGFLA